MRGLIAMTGALAFAFGAAEAQKYGTEAGAAPAGGGIGAHDPAGLVAAIQGLGYRASLGTDDAGTPKIESAGDGINYTIYFYGCEGGLGCDSLLFVAGFDLAAGAPPGSIEGWNEGQIMGTAYADANGDPFISYHVITTGGLRPETFAAVWEEWRGTAYRFAEATGFFQ